MRRKIIPAALLLAFSGLANALGLGDIEMHSALNQPLDAEIPLTAVSPGETDDMLVTLASQEAFQRAGIDRPFSLTQLKFLVETKADGSAVVKVASKKPIVEPFLNFLIEVDWPNGRLIREYTVLLDPPVFMTQKSAEVASETKAETSSNTPAPAPAPKDDIVSKSEVTPRPIESTITDSDNTTTAALIPEYGPVKSNDTLWVIANSVRSDDAHVNQMMIAILQLNPNSFIRGNINLLKKGVVLRIPNPIDVESISIKEATASVKQQNVLWREYVAAVRKTKAVEVATAEKTSAVTAVGAPTESSQNQVASTKEGSDIAKEKFEASQSQLKLIGESKIAEADKTTQKETASSESGAENQEKAEVLTRELALAEEELETQKLENSELNSRINELEESLSKMERLITLRENQLSELQDRLVDNKDQAVKESAAGEDAPAPQLAPVEKEVSAEAEQGQSPPVAQAETDGEGSFIDTLLGQRNMLAIAAVIFALILVLFYVRRKKASDDEFTGEEVVVGGPEAVVDESVDALSEEASDAVEHSETIVTVSDDSIDEIESADSTIVQEDELDRTVVIDDSDIDNLDPTVQISSDEPESVKDDTVAEADVYLAYGLYGQAEDLLKLAIEDNPTKEDYHFKLLETYYADKNAAEFADSAQTYNEILGGKGSPLWDKAITMGKDLCPDNPLFSDADVSKLSGENYSGDATEMPDGATVIIGQNDGYDQLGQSPQEKLDETVLVGSNKNTDFESDDSTQVDEGEAAALTAVHEASEGNSQVESKVDLDSDLDLDATSTQGLEFDIDELAENPELLDSEDGGTFTEAAGLDFDMDENDLSNTNIELSATDLDLSNIESESPQSESLDEPSTEVENLYDIDSTSIDDEAAVAIDEDAEPGTYILDDTFMDDESLSLDMTDGFDVGNNDEVDTMLDLAKAYIDMGDTKSASSTLKEVTESGSEQQQVEAKKLLEQIA